MQKKDGGESIRVAVCGSNFGNIGVPLGVAVTNNIKKAVVQMITKTTSRLVCAGKSLNHTSRIVVAIANNTGRNRCKKCSTKLEDRKCHSKKTNEDNAFSPGTGTTGKESGIPNETGKF